LPEEPSWYSSSSSYDDDSRHLADEDDPFNEKADDFRSPLAPPKDLASLQSVVEDGGRMEVT
jgi:hypothetical protein